MEEALALKMLHRLNIYDTPKAATLLIQTLP